MITIVSLPIAAVLDRQFLHNSLQAWLTAGITTAVVLVLGVVLRQLLVSRIGAIAARTSNQVDDMFVELIRDTRTWIIVTFCSATARATGGGKALPTCRYDAVLPPANSHSGGNP